MHYAIAMSEFILQAIENYITFLERQKLERELGKVGKALIISHDL